MQPRSKERQPWQTWWEYHVEERLTSWIDSGIGTQVTSTLSVGMGVSGAAYVLIDRLRYTFHVFPFVFSYITSSVIVIGLTTILRLLSLLFPDRYWLVEFIVFIAVYFISYMLLYLLFADLLAHMDLYSIFAFCSTILGDISAIIAIYMFIKRVRSRERSTNDL